MNGAPQSTCCNGTCGRKQPIRIFLSDLTNRAYAVLRYTERPGGQLNASVKHDVTADVAALMAEAWAKGWDDCAAAQRGDVVRNPYERGTGA